MCMFRSRSQKMIQLVRTKTWLSPSQITVCLIQPLELDSSLKLFHPLVILSTRSFSQALLATGSSPVVKLACVILGKVGE